LQDCWSHCNTLTWCQKASTHTASHAHFPPGSFLPLSLYLSEPLNGKFLHVTIHDIMAVRAQPQAIRCACAVFGGHVRVESRPTGRCCGDVSSLTDIAVLGWIVRDRTERRRSTSTAFSSCTFVEDRDGTLRKIISPRFVLHF